MRLNIKGTNMELTPAIRAYVEKKLSVVEKYLGENVDAVARVEVGKITHHHKSGEIFKAEVHIIGGGVDQYAVVEQADLYAAIDMLKDEIVQNLNNEKGKRFVRARRGARMIKEMMRGLNPFKKRF
ncbi:MAG: ribosome-associated translation inhibitor RaiA [Patescibacteria group bacterium]